jgi:hypothetical protein
MNAYIQTSWSLFKALKDPNCFLLTQALGLAAQLKRLFTKEGEKSINGKFARNRTF